MNRPAFAAEPRPTPGRPARPADPDLHLDILARHLRDLLPAFVARDGARGDRDRVLPIAEGLLRGRNAIRTGPHGRHRGRRHLLIATLHAAHLAYPGPPTDRLTHLLDLQRTRLARHHQTARIPWLEHPPRRHYDRALTQAVNLAHELDRPGGPTPHRLQAQAADLANRILYFLILTDALDAG